MSYLLRVPNTTILRPDTSYLKGQGDFSLAKGTSMRNLSISIGTFEGHQGKDQGQRRQLPPLPPLSIRPVFSYRHKGNAVKANVYELRLHLTSTRHTPSILEKKNKTNDGTKNRNHLSMIIRLVIIITSVNIINITIQICISIKVPFWDCTPLVE